MKALPDTGNAYTRWTPQCDAYMREHYGPDGGVAVAKYLERTLRSVQHRALFLRLPRSNGWNPEDNTYLIHHYAFIGARGCQPKLSVLRTRKAIIEHAHRLGLRYDDTHPTATAKPQRWLPGEDATLRRHIGEYTVRHIYAQFFTGNPYTRTYMAVALRCSALGLTRAFDNKTMHG